MRMPYPYKTPVDAGAEDVITKVLVDMPVPNSPRVHLANEHRIDPDKYDSSEETGMAHLTAHMYGQFRVGKEHYHVRGEHF